MINKHPTICNLCGGKVILVSNSRIYGKEHGSGKCFLCTKCRAYVGTHVPNPTEALGILANPQMREAKKKCHSLFDPHWIAQDKRITSRTAMYKWLAREMRIPVEECHFGNFDIDRLHQAYRILWTVKNKKMRLSKKGHAIFE